MGCGRGYLFLIILLLVSTVSASCEEGQININSADVNELDKLIGIGPVKAQAIIDSRPFESIGDLIKVKGIGNATLEKIKNQGLACVEEGENSTNDSQNIPNKEEKINVSEEENNKEKSSDEQSIIQKEVVIETTSNTSKINEVSVGQVIKLNTQEESIKSENVREFNKEQYSFYGLIAFCILLALLFGLKLTRDKKKNEIQ